VTQKPVRTRFAPSPTGPLHIGGVRNALLGWLYARHHGGQAILRIEDTDQTRFVEGSTEGILAAFEWLGIDFDEGPHVGGPFGPYKQSERLESYKKWSTWLLENDKAYKSYETSEELTAISQERQSRKLPPGYDNRGRGLSAEQQAAYDAEGRPYVIRFKMPLEGKTVAHDLIRGTVEFANTLNQDPVIIKSDGFPTYHFAHVVDDYLMQISHVTRGNEWIPSLPIHWNLWEALGWEPPVYAHLPLILNPNGKGKMSKRYAAFEEGGQRILVLAQEYIDAGYLPEAVMNFLTNIGWNFGDDREIFTVQEAIERFDLAEVNATNSAFPIEKLDWLNGQYIREMDAEELAKCLRPVLEKADLTVDEDLLQQLAPVVQTRLKTLNDVVDLAGFFFRDYDAFVAPDSDMLIQKKMNAEDTVRMLQASVEQIDALETFDHQTQYEAFKALAKELGVKNGQLFGTLRVALTSQTISTPTFETMEILGKEESKRRLQLAINAMQA
jgi:glutamyl-tRNA synthetase